jgi:hypothetical protein
VAAGKWPPILRGTVNVLSKTKKTPVEGMAPGAIKSLSKPSPQQTKPLNKDCVAQNLHIDSYLCFDETILENSPRTTSMGVC